jgi:hypothetical protein
LSSFGISDPRGATRLAARPIAMNVLRSLR